MWNTTQHLERQFHDAYDACHMGKTLRFRLLGGWHQFNIKLRVTHDFLEGRIAVLDIWYRVVVLNFYFVFLAASL